MAFSESLRTAFIQLKSKIGVSVVCPGIVNTRITDSERNRPTELRGPDYETGFERFIKLYPKSEETVKAYIKMYEEGTTPDQAGDVIFECVKKNIFYVFTETGSHWKEYMLTRFDGILKDFKQNKSILSSL